MILLIDTTKDKTRLSLFDSKKSDFIDEIQFQKKLTLSEEMLSEIDQLLSKHHLGKKDITKIAVNPGPGSYTGVRIGVATANALAFAFNVPVFAIKEGAEDLMTKTCEIKSEKFDAPVLPIYKYPPHITKSKPRL
jgi:tRNA threonylcarbamoyladenosine biosynthesis protein TsaB